MDGGDCGHLGPPGFDDEGGTLLGRISLDQLVTAEEADELAGVGETVPAWQVGSPKPRTRKPRTPKVEAAAVVLNPTGKACTCTAAAHQWRVTKASGYWCCADRIVAEA